MPSGSVAVFGHMLFGDEMPQHRTHPTTGRGPSAAATVPAANEPSTISAPTPGTNSNAAPVTVHNATAENFLADE